MRKVLSKRLDHEPTRFVWKGEHKHGPADDRSVTHKLIDAKGKKIEMRSNVEWRIIKFDEEKQIYHLQMTGWSKEYSLNKRLHGEIQVTSLNGFDPAIIQTCHSCQGCTMKGKVNIIPEIVDEDDFKLPGFTLTKEWLLSALGRSSDFDIVMWIYTKGT